MVWNFCDGSSFILEVGVGGGKCQFCILSYNSMGLFECWNSVTLSKYLCMNGAAVGRSALSCFPCTAENLCQRSGPVGGLRVKVLGIVQQRKTVCIRVCPPVHMFKQRRASVCPLGISGSVLSHSLPPFNLSFKTACRCWRHPRLPFSRGQTLGVLCPARRHDLWPQLAPSASTDTPLFQDGLWNGTVWWCRRLRVSLLPAGWAEGPLRSRSPFFEVWEVTPEETFPVIPQSGERTGVK